MNQPETMSEMHSQPFALPGDTQLLEGRATILLVEDEALVREAMCEALVWAGFRVLKGGNAAEARGVFRRCRGAVNLLLADVVLPDQNGNDLAKELRTICPELKTILISGYPENAVTRQSSMEAGMFYLPKPFTTDSLVHKVRLALAEQITDIAI